MRQINSALEAFGYMLQCTIIPFGRHPPMDSIPLQSPVRTKVKVGIPVHVHYVGTGDNMMVDRVILDED